MYSVIRKDDIWNYTGHKPVLSITDFPTSPDFCQQAVFPMCIPHPVPDM